MMHIDTQADLLKWLVDNKYAGRIRIKYNTNGTRLPTEQLEFWSSFKAVEINVSVDGIGDRFEYLRFPAKWNTVDSTISYYKNLQKTVPKLELTVISTISVLSIGYIHEIVEYCRQRDLNLFMNMLESPAPLNVFNFDEQVKSWISKQIQHIDHPVIKNLLASLNTKNATVNKKMLLDFLAPLDQRRDLDVRKTFPELVQCLELET
jgi:MoaA/NifB/PqqE/SkfB family radical SAM enzyme